MSIHINIFEPFTSKQPHHEDTLTRAFLIVLKAVPLAHAAWLELVAAGHRCNEGTGDFGPLHDLLPPEVDTQVRRLPHPVDRVVSLLQTDAPYTPKRDVVASNRKQCLDGVISYPPKLAIVLENKLWAGAVWEGQLNINMGEPDDAEAERPRLDQKVSCVTWPSVLEAWVDILQTNTLGPAERMLLADFVELVERHFEHLRPYGRVGHCKGSEPRLRRRCRSLLFDLVGPDAVEYHRNWGTNVALASETAASKIGFFPNDPGTELMVVVALADIVRQAKKLYPNFHYSRVQTLIDAGWEVETNLHASFMQQGLFYPTKLPYTARYWSLWGEHPEWIRQWRRDEFDSLFALLLEHGLTHPGDRAAFDDEFTNTDRNKLNLCPGILVRYRIPFDRAAALDDQHELEDVVWQEMQRVASAFDLHLPARVQRTEPLA